MKPTPKPSAISEIRPGQSIELLKELHLLTRDGRLNQDARRKLKQIYHLYHFIEPLLQKMLDKNECFTLADHGAGKSYLGFILYDLFFKQHVQAHIYGIETRADLVEKSEQLALRSGFTRMRFLNASVQDAMHSNLLPETIDCITALHACDTATDDAIQFGLRKQASYMVLIPCCQAEVARALNQTKADSLRSTPFAELWRHPLHTREFGSQATNVLRSLQLQAHGYQVTVTELVGWEHSMKNELLIAQKLEQPNHLARQRLDQLLEELNLQHLTERFS